MSLGPSRLVGWMSAIILAGTPSLAAQTADSVRVPVSDAGVLRATAIVNDVFVDRRTGAGAVGGADWTAYLMARLGVRPIPSLPSMAVSVDSSGIVLASRIGDLPKETRVELGPMVGFLDPATPISALITLSQAGPEAVRFHLQTVNIAGFAVPEPFLQPYLAGVGQRYPALTSSGRDLLVQIPPNGRVALGADSIHLSLP
ncbi:MAG TPA: hypothetical protein VJN95_06585 [Gemmatimonadales bacterium]|nr:hypothetical protein [Gemmatimonadales bacterium]